MPTAELKIAVAHTEPPYSVDLAYKWLVIQDSSKYYEVKNNGTPISQGYEYFFAHSTRRLTSSAEVMNLEQALRQCIEQTDNTLTIFPKYERKYCLVECGIQESLRRCGCALHSSPAPLGVPFCTANSLRCAQMVAGSPSCDCPEACEYVNSKIVTNQLQFVTTEHTFDPLYEDLLPENVSIVRVYSPNVHMLVTRRECYFTFFDLISQFGGVFNVYLGCSFISAVELMFVLWRAVRTFVAPL